MAQRISKRKRDSAPLSTRSASGSPPTVLILDDDPWVRESIRFLMQDDGYAVLEAEGATQALELMRAQPRLIVLIDLLLREGSGFQVIEALAQDDALAARHAAIVCTAHKNKPEDIGPQLRGAVRAAGDFLHRQAVRD